MSDKHVTVPLSEARIRDLKCGDRVLISGTIYTARDAAHIRILSGMDSGVGAPFPLRGSIIYYAGPSPARPGNISGSFGPTTSCRMDKMTPRLLDNGLSGMIGKGVRSPEVIRSMIRNGAVYFAAIGGAGALIADSVRKIEVIAYEELGAEAVRRIEVENFPAIVAIDCRGNSIYSRSDGEDNCNGGE